MKKAQITMESLLLYGAAILIVLLAIGALTYFGVLDMGGYLPEKCNLESTGFFKCEEYAVSSSDAEVNLVVRNTGSKSIEVSEASFTPDDSALADDCDNMNPSPVTILPGESKQITIECTGINVAGGDRIQGTVLLTHKLIDGLLETKTSGDLIATVSE